MKVAGRSATALRRHFRGTDLHPLRGLCVAIPSYVAHRYLRGRVDGIVVRIEKDVVRFAEALNDRAERAAEEARP